MVGKRRLRECYRQRPEKPNRAPRECDLEVMTAGEHDRARRDPGRRSPERRPAAERADDPLAEDADEDRPIAVHVVCSETAARETSSDSRSAGRAGPSA